MANDKIFIDEMGLFPRRIGKSIFASAMNSMYGNSSTDEKTDDGTTPADEEWIWVEGYKGTDKNMCCKGYQYTLNKQHDMPEGSNIKECESGFHFCLNLNSVFGYYSIGNGNRFFKVSALVRKKEYDEYQEAMKSPSRWFGLGFAFSGGKFTSKSIIFTAELTADEILKDCGIDNMTEEEKKQAMEIGVQHVKNERKKVQDRKDIQELASYGYSEAFATYLVNEGWTDTAKAVGTQTDLSMDMKVLTILREHFYD